MPAPDMASSTFHILQRLLNIEKETVSNYNMTIRLHHLHQFVKSERKKDRKNKSRPCFIFNIIFSRKNEYMTNPITMVFRNLAQQYNKKSQSKRNINSIYFSLSTQFHQKG